MKTKKEYRYKSIVGLCYQGDLPQVCRKELDSCKKAKPKD